MLEKTRKRLLSQGDGIIVEAFEKIRTLAKEHDDPNELELLIQDVLRECVPQFTNDQYARFFHISSDQEKILNDVIRSADFQLLPYDSENLDWKDFVALYG